ncbi:MAG: SDR family NAD(P)-dependent oxidoreductase [Planctomycetota bacterium]
MTGSPSQDRPTSVERVAIVTGGAGSGVGSGVSRVLAMHGWHVVVVGRNEAQAESMINDIASAGGSALFVRAELTDDDAPKRCVQAALDWKGRLDGLVNNAGIGCVGGMDQVDDDQLDHVINVNLKATYRLSREAMKPLIEARGAIVNISSVHGLHPMPHFTGYALTKGGVQALSRAMAVDLGPAGVRVNCVLPGMVDCDQTRQVTAQHTDDVEAYLQQWTQTRQLLPSLVRNTDVGELVEFLLSDRAAGMTAQTLVIDGGTTTMLTDRDPTPTRPPACDA